MIATIILTPVAIVMTAVVWLAIEFGTQYMQEREQAKECELN